MYIMNLMKRLTMLIALLMLGVSVYAESPTSVNKAMNELVKKYDGAKGVNCVTVTKGQGLEVMKLMLNGELGKSFMKGVTSITVIDYSAAPAEVCDALRKDINVFTSLLQEFDVSQSKDLSKSKYTRCFACTSAANEGRLSDFVLAIEEGETRSIMYMAGEICVK